MGITIFTIFIWGGIWSDIQSEIREPSLSDCISEDIPPSFEKEEVIMAGL